MLFIRKVEEKDIKTIYDWSNDAVSRLSSLNSSIINWDEHEKWFYSKINSEKCNFFICFNQDNEECALVRFELKENLQWVVGIVVSPHFRGQGIGKQALELALNSFSKSKVVYAFIKKDNISSQKIFEFNQFVQVEDGDILIYKRVI